MSGRLVVLLGIVTIGAALGIVGVAQPASADLFFGQVNLAGTCINHVPPIPNCGGATGSGVPTSAVDLWHGGTVTPIDVTSMGFAKNGTPLTQFIDPTLLTLGQSGIGIAAPAGGSDNEINNVLPLTPPLTGNYDTLLVTSPHTFSGTISIDSLQISEQAEVCAEPTQFAFGPTGGANCVLTAAGDGTPATLSQELPLPAAYSAANPWLAVDAVNPPLGITGVISDVKVEDLDVTVPEPGTVALLLTGVAGLALARRRRNLI